MKYFSPSFQTKKLGFFLLKSTGESYDTPLLLQTTKCGSIPYLTSDVFGYCNKGSVMHVSLETIYSLRESFQHYVTQTGNSFNSFVGYNRFPMAITLHNPFEESPSGFHEKDTISLFTKRGKELVSAYDYMKLMEVMRPNMYQGLCDADTDENSSNKRVYKSLCRTMNFMQECFNMHANSPILHTQCLLAPIVGGYNRTIRLQSIEFVKKYDNLCDGYIFEGFHKYGNKATEINNDKFVEIVTECLRILSTDKPIMFPGAYTPPMVLKLISLGCNIFDTSYAYCATESCKALTFHFELTPSQTFSDMSSSPFLDITDDSMKNDLRPLLEGCQCYCCRGYTRSYLYHLYETAELLGPTLLMIHNTQHMIWFFDKIRAAIRADNMNELIKLVTYQTSDTEINYCIKTLTKSNLVKHSRKQRRKL